MPRQRDIVMANTTAEALKKAIIKSAIEKHQPYEVFSDPVDKDFVVVYINPLTLTRELIARRNRRSNAIKLRKMLERAWVEGVLSKTE